MMNRYPRTGHGRGVPSNLPAWYSAIAPGTWGVLSTSTLAGSGVMLANGDRVMSAWGGGVINTTGVYVGANFIPWDFLILFGGGHSDYSGNEVYAFGPLISDAPSWYRLRDATSPAPQDVPQDASGNPVSRHTYNTLTYVGDGIRNWLVSTGILYSWFASNSYSNTQVFDFGSASPNTVNPWIQGKSAVPSGAGDVSAYDSSSGKIWSHAGAQNNVQLYDVASDTYLTQQFKSPAFGENAMSAVDTVRGIWAICGATGINFYRTNNAVGNDYYSPTVTGTAPTGSSTLVYDPVADAFKVWTGGTTIYSLTPPTALPYAGGNAWAWSSFTPSAGATPTAASANGTFGRFAWVKRGNAAGYVLLNSASDSVYFYRP